MMERGNTKIFTAYVNADKSKTAYSPKNAESNSKEMPKGKSATCRIASNKNYEYFILLEDTLSEISSSSINIPN